MTKGPHHRNKFKLPHEDEFRNSCNTTDRNITILTYGTGAFPTPRSPGIRVLPDNATGWSVNTNTIWPEAFIFGYQIRVNHHPFSCVTR